MESHLDKAERKRLRKLGQALKSVVLIGKNGVNKALLSEIQSVLTAHELVKAKVLPANGLSTEECATLVSMKLGAELVETRGRTFLLYKENPDKSEHVLD